MEDSMGVKNVFETQGNVSCLRDLSENGDDLIHFNSMVSDTTGEAEKCGCRQVHSCPASAVTCHTDSCCLSTEGSVSGQSLADVQACKKSGLGKPLATSALFSEWADTPVVNHSCSVKGDSENPAAALESYAEIIPNVSDDCSDDDLEYFECSDVLTERENEIWQKKLQFLLDGDDEGDLKLGKDCDGCAYFLSEMPCVFQVSDDTTPMDTIIGFCGHHSTFKGVNVRRDPSTFGQTALQAEMTLTVGHHRDKGTSVKDKEKGKVPGGSAAIGSDHPRAEEGNNGSGRSAAGFSPDRLKHKDNTHAEVDSAPGSVGGALANQAPETMTANCTDTDSLGESSLLLEEEGRDLPEENARHAICTLTESLRRNLLKFLNPKELCRYVSSIGQSFQPAAEVRDCSAPLPSQEGLISTNIPEATAGLQMRADLSHMEEADKGCDWEGKSTQGLPEQKQMPDETVSPKNQGANLKLFTQNCERLCKESEIEKKGIFVSGESARTIHPPSEMLWTEKALQAKHGAVQTGSQHQAPCDKGEGCHPEVFCAREIDIICKANLKSVLESGEPGCKGDADVSAVHDKLWKLLHEDESDCQIPFATQGITSLNIRVTAIGATELNLAQETCSGYPLPMNVMEHQEPVGQGQSRSTTMQPATTWRMEKEDCDVSSIPLKADEACNCVSVGNICLAQVIGTDGVCLDSSTRSKMETPSVCVSADSIALNTGKHVEPKPNETLTDSNESTQTAFPWEGRLATSNASQTWEAGSPQRLKSSQGSNLVCDNEKPTYVSDGSRGPTGQLFHTEYRISLVNEPRTGQGCHIRAYRPAPKDLVHCPEEKDVFPSENTNQFAHEEHSPASTIPKSSDGNLQTGNHSDLNAQTKSNLDSCHLSKSHGCQEFQVVSNAQKYGNVMQLPDLIRTAKTITHKNVPQNTDQLTEIEKQEVLTPSSDYPLLRDLDVEVPRYEPRNSGKGQREICVVEASCESGVSHVSKSQAAVFPQNTAEQPGFFVASAFKSAEEIKTDSSKNQTRSSLSVTSVGAPLDGKAQCECHSVADGACRDSSDGLGSQQLTARETLLLATPVSQPEGLCTRVSIVGCPGAGNQVKREPTETAVRANGSVSVRGASQDHLQREPKENKEGAILCENTLEVQRAVECNPCEAEVKSPSRSLIFSKAQRQTGNIGSQQPCPDWISPGKLAGGDHSIQSPASGKEEEAMASESAVRGSVHLPPVNSGNNQYFREQRPCSRTQPFSSASPTYDPFPVHEESLRNPEGLKSYQTLPTAAEPEHSKCRQETAKSGHLAAGAKKKLPPATLSKKPRLEERGTVGKDPSCGKRSVKSEAGVIHKEDRKEQRRLIVKNESKAPKLLKKIQAELFPDCSGNIMLCCQFGDIHGDSTITWTKDSKLLAQLQRSAQDDSPVSLAIAKASNKDQGMYYCCLHNAYGKVTAEFNLTSQVLEHLSSSQNCEGVEEIEFMQLMFREDFISDSYFGGNLHGLIATEELHFGEGMHRKAFRSKVMRGLVPVFGPGHSCVLKVHNAILYGTKSKDDLVQKNYKLALQECYVQNTAREYAKVYAAEAELLEGFGEVPEIIPIFLVHRPANNIPYATVEEELVGEFVKYSVRDGKEVNFLRRDSEAGQKCCTFQHWVYEKTSGSLLVTDLQGVGMKLTDVGIATLAKGYKGFKGNCSISFIEQFRALHQCNRYCEMLGLKSLRSTHQKQRKAASMKSKNLPNSSTVKKTLPKKVREPRDFIPSEH
ncbi:alpha-protein kinase 2 [Cuculus canorus]|uniref:alpha-protein kinase 2 n=1 Tax=Cuculus canorus TaxID=55661 RepID=UPI0023AB2359|nr:alpha-protein kinase 2 [Cuculus canorus]XP_053909325.1 alpha-protein kinase 2 [Cuculus canorus]XP_053909327.1 alpha-protein kinase 2 [Cuculus canorus]